MSIGAWIVLGLAVAIVAFFASRAFGGSRAGSDESDLSSRFKAADALALELGRQCVDWAEALPVIDERTSWLLHEPIYDARTDVFDPPCVENGFEYSSGRCWVAGEGLGDVFRRWSGDEAQVRLGLSRPRTTSLIRAADYIDMVWCFYSVNEPGLQALRLCRVDANRWHKHVWQCGMGPSAGTVAIGTDDGKIQIRLASDSGELDPPLLARDVAEDPSLWTQWNALVRARRSADPNWREAVAHCKHLPAN
jgi:hypothetical protein